MSIIILNSKEEAMRKVSRRDMSSGNICNFHAERLPLSHPQEEYVARENLYDFIQMMASELSEMAKGAQNPLLRHLLSMATLEARISKEKLQDAYSAA